MKKERGKQCSYCRHLRSLLGRKIIILQPPIRRINTLVKQKILSGSWFLQILLYNTDCPQFKVLIVWSSHVGVFYMCNDGQSVVSEGFFSNCWRTVHTAIGNLIPLCQGYPSSSRWETELQFPLCVLVKQVTVVNPSGGEINFVSLLPLLLSL